MKNRLIPGFGINLGFSLFYLSAILLIPLSILFFKGFHISFEKYLEIITQPRNIHAFYITLYTSFIASMINLVIGFIITWTIVKYDFWGKKILDTLIDMPFTLPTAVAGITITSIYSKNGWIGKILAKYDISAVYNTTGIILALTFVGLPFVIRTLEPVLESIGKEHEEAAYSLGANRFQTFYKVILPELKPALITGTSLAFARGIGEYGSVVFISGNMPYKTEIVSLLIVSKLEQYDFDGAIAISITIILLSFIIMLTINILQRMYSKRFNLG